MGALHPVHVYQLIMTNSVEDMLQTGDLGTHDGTSKPSLCLAAESSQNTTDPRSGSPSKRARRRRAKTLTKKHRRNIQKIELLMSNLRLWRLPEQSQKEVAVSRGSYRADTTKKKNKVVRFVLDNAT